jgi:hypothetical protein
MVDQPEQQAIYFLPISAQRGFMGQLTQFFISIIGQLLINNGGYQVEIGRGMDTIPFPITEPATPIPIFTKDIHHCLLLIFTKIEKFT